MNEISQAIGDLAQGGLAARAVEPAHGERTAADGHSDRSTCLNCGTVLVGSHCHACGQSAHVHKTLGAFFHDLLHGVLHFEGKLWRTLPMLAFRPGRLTREYIDGRRASYISPIAMFLFVTFLFFALFHALGVEEKWAEGIRSTTNIDTAQAIATASGEIGRLQGRLAREEDADDRAELARDIATLERQRGALVAALKSGGPGLDVNRNGEVVTTGEGVRSLWQKAKADPQLLINKWQTNAYKFAWLLIPISVPFVALTFLWRRKFGLYDHTIFTTYSITFMFALVSLATLVGYWRPGVGLLLLFYAPAHMYWQLRGTYGLGRLSAFWRMLALSAFAWIAIVIFAALITAMAEG